MYYYLFDSATGALVSDSSNPIAAQRGRGVYEHPQRMNPHREAWDMVTRTIVRVTPPVDPLSALKVKPDNQWTTADIATWLKATSR